MSISLKRLSIVLLALFLLVWFGFATRRPIASDAPNNNNVSKVSAQRVSHNEPQVVVVGAGISGLSCALELARGGATVTVVDMSSIFGGHAVMSQGGLSIIDTPLQRANGLQDSPDLAYQDFIKWGEDADKKWVRYYVNSSRKEIYDWLIELGVQFTSVEPAPGNSVDRFHQPAGRGMGLVGPVYQACLHEKNIRFVWSCQVKALTQQDQRVTGVEAWLLREKKTVRFSADAVVLATGGFQSNLDMVREFWPKAYRFPKRIFAGSGRNSIGLGHKLATSAGGELTKMDHQWNYFTGIPDPRNPTSPWGLSAANMHGIIVNANGRRFANLHGWAKEVMPKLLSQDDATLWFVFDESTKRKFTISGSEWADFDKVDRLVLQNKSLVKKASSITELARLSGLPANELNETIQRYNRLVRQGKDEDFDRFGPDKTEYNNTASPAIETAPFYAMRAYPLTRKSMGGVAIDLSCRVVSKQGKPIAGLYAVGELTGLAGINGKAALEGTFLGPCVLTGRTAAKAINLEWSRRHKAEPVSSKSCVECHDIDARLREKRGGYWHFEQAHQLAKRRKFSCIRCHQELSPYREGDHRIHPARLAGSCALCHVSGS